MRAFEVPLVANRKSAFQPAFLDEFNANAGRFAREEMIEIRPVPMRVRDCVVRTRRDKKLPLMVVVVMESTVEVMVEKGEATLQTARDDWVLTLPGSIFCERKELRQIIASGEFFEQQVGERRGRFSDGKPRMFAAFEQNHGKPEPTGDHRDQRAGETGADDGEVMSCLHPELIAAIPRGCERSRRAKVIGRSPRFNAGEAARGISRSWTRAQNSSRGREVVFIEVRFDGEDRLRMDLADA